MNYIAKNNRYETMKYNRCGSSGLRLPAMSLGLWHNFGDVDNYENSKEMIKTAFDLGITHFDLANNSFALLMAAADGLAPLIICAICAMRSWVSSNLIRVLISCFSFSFL